LTSCGGIPILAAARTAAEWATLRAAVGASHCAELDWVSVADGRSIVVVASAGAESGPGTTLEVRKAEMVNAQIIVTVRIADSLNCATIPDPMFSPMHVVRIPVAPPAAGTDVRFVTKLTDNCR
jgi:hypothetical protein